MTKKLQFSIIVTAILFTGCGAKYSKVSSNQVPSPYSSAVTYQESSPIAHAPIAIKRIITKRANISVEVEAIDKAQKALVALVKENGGYITNSNHYEDGYNASVKIPSSKLVETLDAIAGLGDKISQSISQNDVTRQFVDNEARLKNLILFRDKMQKLLTHTTNIQEIVKIEREIRRVQIEIDSLKGRQKYLQDAVALSPIRVNFKEKTVYGPIGYIANGVWWVTKKLFIIK